jgi:hypothetical protein
VQWFTHIIPVTWEAEIRRILVPNPIQVNLPVIVVMMGNVKWSESWSRLAWATKPPSPK